jgi:hypothetical protein
MKATSLSEYLTGGCGRSATELPGIFGILLERIEARMRDQGEVLDASDPRWLTRWFMRTEKRMDMSRLTEQELWILLGHAIFAGSNDFGAPLLRDLARIGVAVEAEWCFAAALFSESWTGISTQDVLAELIAELGLTQASREALQTVRSDPRSLVPWLNLDRSACIRWADGVDARLRARVDAT